MHDEWYKDWFNSPYYHILYKHRDDSEAAKFIDQLSGYLTLNNSHLIWDLACGKGRHSLYLNKKGFNVIGTDLSFNNIKEASGFSNERLEFFVHDMRRPFRMNYFTHVLNLFTSIGYFENFKDNYKVFRNVQQSLQSGGLFVLDFFNAEKVRADLKPVHEKEIEGIKFKITKTIKEDQIVKTIAFTDQERSCSFTEKVSLLTLDDFKAFARDAKLQLVNTFGDYDLNSFDAKNSDRLILIFKK
jgi:cyclopropane fatty-acyl-phospholipid synthase-like methyltransferase